jgi:hypothetical protein
LASFAKTLGAAVRVVREPHLLLDGKRERDLFFVAPFSFEAIIDWVGRRIYVGSDELKEVYCVGGLIHELGHLTAVSAKPDDSIEYDFLGWEWQVAKKTACSRWWFESMRGYQVCVRNFEPLDIEKERLAFMRFANHTEEFQELSPRDRLRCLRAAVARGKELGNISVSGEPLAVR